MKLSEFDKIRPFLPDDTEVTVNPGMDNSKSKPLEKITWGNHDGRYNAKCPVCGWMSDDIPARQPMPSYCPQCGNGGPKNK